MGSSATKDKPHRRNGFNPVPESRPPDNKAAESPEPPTYMLHVKSTHIENVLSSEPPDDEPAKLEKIYKIINDPNLTYWATDMWQLFYKKMHKGLSIHK